MARFSGVLAWHPEVSMTADETNDFLSGRWVARMATIGRDGYPVVTPLWYLWDGKCLYFNIAKSRQSLKNRARNPKVSVVIDMDERPLMGMRANFAKAVLVVGDRSATALTIERNGFPTGKHNRLDEHPSSLRVLVVII